MTITEALAHVRYTQKYFERNAEQSRRIDDAVGYNYYKCKAESLEIVLDEVNRLSKELLVAVSQR